MSSSVTVCINCRLRAAFRDLTLPRQSWRQNRHLAGITRQRKVPPRMILSDDVGRSSKPSKRTRDDEAGPFAGMNRTEANLRPSSLRKSVRSPRAEASESPPKSGKAKKDKDDRPLFHALKMQATLTPLSYDARASLKDRLDKIQSFDELGLRTDVLNAVRTQALPDLQTLTPTPAQKLAIPVLLSRKGQFEKKKNSASNEYDQFLLAAETGSGKTLAYLLPVINALKNQEDVEKAEMTDKEGHDAANKIIEKDRVFDVKDPDLADAENPDSSSGRPRVLILQPSSELVGQIGKVVKAMSHTVKYRSAPISSAHSPTVIKSRLFNPNGIDVVVSTPHLISSIAEKEPNILSRVNYIVVDEADSLFDRSFRDITLGIIDRAAPSLKQLILCSATIPRSLDSFIDKRFQSMRRLVTPKLHSIPRRVQLGVVDIEKEPYRGNRDLACADVVWQLGKAIHDDVGSNYLIKHIIIFVNEREKAEELAAFLAAKGIDATALTRDTSEQRQGDILASFTSPDKVEGEPKKRLGSDFIPFEGVDKHGRSDKASRMLENTKVLVTTDLGSRGIDTLAVRHAVLYDVPHTTIDFVHRLGRLGRMNRRGRGIVLVGKKDRKDVVREVREAMFKGQALI